MSDDAVDVLIICALPEELDALLEVRDGVREPWTKVDGTPPYYTATLTGRAGLIRVAAVRSTRTAGVSTAILSTKLIPKLQPRCLAMCGVCAGHPDDTALGDVVIADRVFQHDAGKYKQSGFEADIETHNLDNDWLHLAQDLAGPAEGFHGYAEPNDEDACWWFLERLVDGYDPQTSAFARYFREEDGVALLQDLQRDRIELREAYVLTEHGKQLVNQRRLLHKSVTVKRLPYHIHVGPIGSGNYVAANGKDWKRITKGGMRRILGVEQEVATIGKVAHDHRLSFVVAKGVMDHATSKKNDRFKKFAARASAEVLCGFLRRVIEPGRDVADPASPSATFEGPARERRFTGRDDELAELENLIATNQSVCVVATGIGGIGKTTLVSEFVATRGRELFPDGVAWLDGSPDRFAGELARVSERFGWFEHEPSRYPTAEEAVAWLRTKLAGKRVLIVVDSLDPERSDHKLVPIPGLPARTVVTSRTRTLDLKLDAARLLLGVWSLEVCRSYLRDNCREDCLWVESASDADLDALAEFVGRLPLGMRLLVTVLRNRSGTSPAELLPLLRAQPIGTLDQHDQERGVAATFRLAYDALPDPKRRVLQALAACARRTRAEIVAAVADAGDVATVRESLDYLRTHGFADLPEHGVWGMHDVVRMFVLAQPGAEAFERRQLDWVFQHLQQHADPTSHSEFGEGVEEATHAFARRLSRDLKIARALYELLLKHLMVVGRYSDAFHLTASLLAATSPGTAEAAVVLGNLGVCYRRLGDVPRAIEHHERALLIDEKLGHRGGQANHLGNLGSCYLALGQLGKAVKYLERSLEINVELDHLETQANQLGNLGVCHMKLHDISRAISYFERALVIDDKLGRLEGQSSHHGNLGLCYQSLCNWSRAIECHERALDIDETLGRVVGQASQLGNLGLCWLRNNDVSEAIEYFERSLAKFESVGSLEGQANQLGNLGLCYLSSGNVLDATLNFERALSIEEKLGSAEGQAKSLASLGLCFEQLGNRQTAVDRFTRARELFRRMVLPDSHPSVAFVEQALARLRSSIG